MSERNNRLSQLSELQRGLLLATLVFLICLLLISIAEAAVRVRHWVKFGGLWGIESTYQKDAESNLRIPIAGSSFGPIEISSLGFRSPEIDVARNGAGLRLAFLGASTTYCAEASSNETTWPHLVWKGVQEQWPDLAVDYVNAGVPGYNTATSVLNLKRRVAALSPDIIIIYHAANDVSFNSYKMARSKGLAELRAEEELMWPSQYSLLWYLVEKNLRILNHTRNARRGGGTLVVDIEELTTPFRRDLTNLVEESKKVSPAVVLITFSTQLRREQSLEEQAEAAATSLFYSPYMSIDGLLDSYDAYNEVIRDVASETGVILIDGEESIPGDSLHFADSVHFTDLGSEAMATRVNQGIFGAKEIQAIIERVRPAVNPET